MKRRIFIVEDHDVVRESYTLFLNMEADLEVCGAAGTAEDALEQLSTAEPDLLLVDVSLPGMSGIELLQKLRSEGAEVPALVVTGHDNDQYRRGAAEAGARGFVMKQEDPDVLVASIREALDEAPAP